MKIRVGIVGCLGKMGRTIINELIENDKVEIAGAVARTHIGSDIGSVLGYGSDIGVKITNSISDVFKSSDVIIDFTAKECMLECLRAAAQFKRPLVSGTTGLVDIDLKEYAAKAPVLWSANMSVGVNVLLKLVKKAAELLSDGYDIEIWEMHHNLKKDSPSGTAIELGKTIADTLKMDFQVNNHLHSNSTVREKNSIGFAVSRGGGVIGDHSVMFVSSGERIELNHKAINRKIFASGAIQAAIWLYENKREIPGLYSILLLPTNINGHKNKVLQY